MTVTLAEAIIDGRAEDVTDIVRQGPPPADAQFVAIALSEPDETELDRIAELFDLPELALEDAKDGHQRAKLERYGEVLFLVLRPAVFDQESKRVRIGELHAFISTKFAITVVKDNPYEHPFPHAALERLQRSSALVGHDKDTVLYALLDVAVDAYGPVADQLEESIDDIEEQLFAGRTGASSRIFEHFTDVIDLQRATHSLPGILSALLEGAEKYGMDVHLQRRFGDVRDHVERLVERVGSFRSLLENALTVDATLVAQKQNDDTKRISSWAAILIVPSIIGSIYGMNFRFMPELNFVWGYPAAIGLMLAVCIVLYVVFRKKHWL